MGLGLGCRGWGIGAGGGSGTTGCDFVGSGRFGTGAGTWGGFAASGVVGAVGVADGGAQPVRISTATAAPGRSRFMGVSGPRVSNDPRPIYHTRWDRFRGVRRNAPFVSDRATRSPSILQFSQQTTRIFCQSIRSQVPVPRAPAQYTNRTGTRSEYRPIESSVTRARERDERGTVGLVSGPRTTYTRFIE
ncbi:hypothetical protein FTUN_2821 [Frigoriglobus tundricola]|uniref:Uncharacterized protein n=1 Tax=Frigoriglobus tundricola TaxID=2774151 RepID=A0A6M5YMD0_9BACT|nr:hypothetical protein FTUN_2821 [Frigoriglobus tundricola]